MKTEELGTKIGNIAAKAFDFIYDNLGNSQEITDELKQKIKTEREKTYKQLLPMVKEYHSLSEEDAAEVGRFMGLSYLQGIDDLENKIKKMESVIGNIENNDDEEFKMDMASLYVVLEFLEKPDDNDEEKKAMLRHIGLLD
ncbi:MAG: hypothetical protein GX259_06580 [Bacteroidales bacterium]|nr:hypothetical protein [Bacteroidales bacterium]